MDLLNRASFGDLFLTTFVVSATFQVSFAVIGILAALMAPGLFQMNGVPAQNPGQAFGTLLFMLAVGLVINAAMASMGSLLWLLVRRVIPAKA
jgi:Na+/phosphate symporter